MNAEKYLRRGSTIPITNDAVRGLVDLARELKEKNELLEKSLDLRTRELIGASLYEHDYKTLLPEYEALRGEVAQLKHMNMNWSISEGWALQEIEMLKHFLKANDLYLSYTEWKHSDAAIKVAEDTMK